MVDKKASALTDGVTLQSTDIIAVSRPDGFGGFSDRKLPIGAAVAAQAAAAATSASNAATSETNAASSASTASAAATTATNANIFATTTQSGTTYTLALADKNTNVDLTNSSGCNVTIPTNASVAFPVGSQIILTHNNAAGQSQLTAAGGVTLESKYGRTKFEATQFSIIYLLKIGTNTWRATGDLST